MLNTQYKENICFLNYFYSTVLQFQSHIYCMFFTIFFIFHNITTFSAVLYETSSTASCKTVYAHCIVSLHWFVKPKKTVNEMEVMKVSNIIINPSIKELMYFFLLTYLLSKNICYFHQDSIKKGEYQPYCLNIFTTDNSNSQAIQTSKGLYSWLMYVLLHYQWIVNKDFS